MVKARVEKSEEKENVRVLHVHIEPDKVKEHLDAAFHSLRRDVEIPGFRKGKVPRPLFERHFGAEVLWEEALEDMISEAYNEAVEQTELEAIGAGELDLTERDADEGVEFTVEVEVMPEVTLGQYTGFDLGLELEDVTEEDVEENLQRFLDSRASMIAVEDEDAELAPGLIAVCDFQAYHEGEPVEQLQGEEAMVEIGESDNLPGFDEALVGAAAGDTREFPSELPAEFPVDELAGEEVTFRVEIKEIKEKDLPELDDELAQEEFGEDSVESLRESLKEQLTHRREETALNDLEQAAADAAVENAELETPDALVSNAIDEMISNTEQRLAGQEITMEQFLASRGMDSMDELREEFRPQAEAQVREMVVLEAIAAEEGIEVSDDELEDEMEEQAMSMGMDASLLRQMSMQNDEYRDRMIQQMRIRKTRGFLAADADPEYDEVKQRVDERREKWQEEYMQRQQEMMEAEGDEAQDPGDDPGTEEERTVNGEPSGEA